MTANIYGRIQNPNVSDYFSIGINLPDLGYSGFVIFDKVLDDVQFGKILYYNRELNGWKICSNLNESTMPARAIYVEDTDNPDIGCLLLYGTVRNISWNFTSNFLYVGSSGNITSTAPSQSDSIIQKIGVLERRDQIFFNFETTWLYVV